MLLQLISLTSYCFLLIGSIYLFKVVCDYLYSRSQTFLMEIRIFLGKPNFFLLNSFHLVKNSYIFLYKNKISNAIQSKKQHTNCSTLFNTHLIPTSERCAATICHITTLLYNLKLSFLCGRFSVIVPSTFILILFLMLGPCNKAQPSEEPLPRIIGHLRHFRMKFLSMSSLIVVETMILAVEKLTILWRLSCLSQ